jgi:hypothetical protein
MTTQPQPRHVAAERNVLEWLLDSDPSIRWQVMRDLTGSPAEEVAAERARLRMDGGAAPRGTAGSIPRCTL